jgi:hypothetical protein
MIKVGSWVHCEYGLGIVTELQDNTARVFIHTLGFRSINLSKLKLANKNER